MTSLAPFLTEADPAQAGEGSLDPLGLAGTAERLAELFAPGITNRMQRVRFVTATAVAAAVTEPLADVVSVDGRTPAYLAFEWHVVLALARDRALPPNATMFVPGITKARTTIRRGGHLDAASYLKTPSVFGFVGVYKRLARALGIVDDSLALSEAGDRLLRVWEREQGLDGFLDRESGHLGGRVAKDFERAVTEALLSGRVVRPLGSHIWLRFVSSLRPDGAGPSERAVLRDLLIDEHEPVRTEFLRRVVRARAETEPEVIREIRSQASVSLGAFLEAVNAYERVAALLTAAFDAVRRASTLEGSRSIPQTEFAKHELVRRASSELPDAVEQASEHLDRIGRQSWIDALIDRFSVPHTPENLLDVLLDHHQQIQAAKPPGKRPWFEFDDRGVWVRRDYVLTTDPAAPDGRYVHPYRVGSVRSLFAEL